ncbi:MAG: multicopper oxidase domain-containing protein [Flavobacteriales bacterium]|nr:multicopper oxidase domain-containing protein [Flavobacteriales bacterium]
MRKIVIFFLLILLELHSVAQIDQSILLIARNSGTKQLADSSNIRIFGFANSLSSQPNVPGPTLTMNEGDSIKIHLWNVSQGAPHTIHLHGLDVDQQNDGVPHLSFDVAHQDHGFYYFKAPHAGTYLYHCHVASTVHVQAGMYGLIIVKPPDGSNTTWSGGYSFDTELSLFMSEIDTTWHTDSVLLHPHDTSMTVHIVSIPDYNPQFFLVNGYSDQQIIENQIELNTDQNKISYLRLANIGYYGNRVIIPSQLNARIVSSDGRPLPQLEYSDTIYVYPGERYGVIVDPQSDFSDSIRIEYLNMNNLLVKGVEKVAVNVGVVGLPDFENKHITIQVFPNPFKDRLYIKMIINKSSKVQINIKDVNGKLVQQVAEKKYTPGEYKLSIENNALIKGTYFITVFTNKKELIIKKIIKQ